MPIRTIKKSTPTKPISQNEWDFSGCPKDEVNYCRFYEFARHDDELKEEIAQRRKKDDWRSGRSPEHWEFYTDRAKLRFFRLFPEFPDRSWLGIPAKERRKRCEECRILEGPFFIVSPERIDPEAGYPYVPTDVGIRTIHRAYAVEIDFSASKEAIKESFERWLGSVHKNSEIVVESRGGVTDADLLKALGAYRLVKQLGHWTEAAEWSANNSSDNKPLYENQSEWIKARKKAENLMTKGVAPSPQALLLARLDLSRLDRQERAVLKVHIATKIDRAETRRLNKLTADKALAELQGAIALAHKTLL